MTISLNSSYADLPDRFTAKLPPTGVAKPELIKLNDELAQSLGFDAKALQTPQALNIFAGNAVAEDSTPSAMAYAGHQFGSWVPQLGDGRAILLGDVMAQDGLRYDIQLKGSGRTPFSRSGDGRAALGPVLREYVVSEAMHALGIPTTRALAAVTTGEFVYREAPLPGAVLTRVARSFVRVGTFQYFAARQDHEALRTLADFMITHDYPHARDCANPYRALLDSVVQAQAKLIAQWLGVGFIHGVMNTDNMSISGETIDYGPCALMDHYEPLKVFSSIDQYGRYAFSRQPDIAHWNLACLARAMLPILGDDEDKAVKQGQEAIDRFPDLFAQNWRNVMGAKLGLSEPNDEDGAHIHGLLRLMAKAETDFTNTFRALSQDPLNSNSLPDELRRQDGFDDWWQSYQKRLHDSGRDQSELVQAMQNTNPAFIPRNHRIENAIQAAYQGDFAPFHELVQVLAKPFDGQPEHHHLTLPPNSAERVTQTFCGT